MSTETFYQDVRPMNAMASVMAAVATVLASAAATARNAMTRVRSGAGAAPVLKRLCLSKGNAHANPQANRRDLWPSHYGC